METKSFINDNNAIGAAWDWLHSQKVLLDDSFEAKSGFGMRTADGLGSFAVSETREQLDFALALDDVNSGY